MLNKIFLLLFMILTSESSPSDNEQYFEKLEKIPEGRGASGKWMDTETPKRGWERKTIVRLDELDTCEMCEREEIRYAHHMQHEIYNGELVVGCICSAYMEGLLDEGSINDAVEKAEKKQRILGSIFNRYSRYMNEKRWKNKEGILKYTLRKSNYNRIKRVFCLIKSPRSLHRYKYSIISENEPTIESSRYEEKKIAMRKAFCKVYPDFKPEEQQLAINE